MSSDGTLCEESLLSEVGDKGAQLEDYISFGHKYNRKHWYQQQIVPWAVAAWFLIVSLLLIMHILTIRTYFKPSQFGAFETGFHTDLEPAKQAMEAKRVQFKGELRFHDNGTMYRYTPGPTYFGPASQEIDDNWYKLLYARGVDLSEVEIEAAGMKGKTWEEPMGGLWRTGLDVFHQLHCLNMVRKALDVTYYPPEDEPRLVSMHTDHCLDYIRQALMCHADSTPVRLEWRKESHFLIPKFDQYHTCRNFELLHEWSKERALEKHSLQAKKMIKELIAAGDL